MGKKSKISFTTINCTAVGCPRLVCHYLNLLTVKEKEDAELSINNGYLIAIDRAKEVKGATSRKYHNKKYGGGIAFATWDDKNQLEKKILKVVKQAEKDENRVNNT